MKKQISFAMALTAIFTLSLNLGCDVSGEPSGNDRGSLSLKAGVAFKAACSQTENLVDPEHTKDATAGSNGSFVVDFTDVLAGVWFCTNTPVDAALKAVKTQSVVKFGKTTVEELDFSAGTTSPVKCSATFIAKGNGVALDGVLIREASGSSCPTVGGTCTLQGLDCGPTTFSASKVGFDPQSWNATLVAGTPVSHEFDMVVSTVVNPDGGVTPDGGGKQDGGNVTPDGGNVTPDGGGTIGNGYVGNIQFKSINDFNTGAQIEATVHIVCADPVHPYNNTFVKKVNEQPILENIPVCEYGYEVTATGYLPAPGTINLTVAKAGQTIPFSVTLMKKGTGTCGLGNHGDLIPMPDKNLVCGSTGPTSQVLLSEFQTYGADAACTPAPIPAGSLVVTLSNGNVVKDATSLKPAHNGSTVVTFGAGSATSTFTILVTGCSN